MLCKDPYVEDWVYSLCSGDTVRSGTSWKGHALEKGLGTWLFLSVSVSLHVVCHDVSKTPSSYTPMLICCAPTGSKDQAFDRKL